MKLLLLSWGIPTKKRPQNGCFAMDQAKALVAAGHHVGMLSINGLIGKEWKKPGLHHWTQDGVECFELFGLPIGIIDVLLRNSWGTKIARWGAKKVFKKVIKEFGFPDIVHAHYLKMMVAGVGIKEKYPVTLVGTEHWSKLAEPPYSQDLINYGNYAYPRVDKLISVSKGLSDYIYRAFKKDSTVVYNMFNTELLKPALSKTNNETYTIVTAGSLIKRKGFDILIDAIAKSDLSRKNIVVKIFGSGSLKEALQQQINNYNLQDKILLCGQKTRDELYEELHKADLFVLSSRQETFSVAVIEALGNGVPAVATECGIIAEYKFNNVIKVPIEDVDAMKEGLEKAYVQREEIDRIAIQQEVMQNFSPEAIVSQLEKVYLEVLKNNKK